MGPGVDPPVLAPVLGEDETQDSLLFGALRLIQKRRGYRFSLDALLLADFVDPHSDTRLVDLGTGCAVIPLLLARLRPFRYAVAVEIQHELAEIARRNVALNHAEGKIQVLHADLRELPRLLGERPFDLVVSNPPYRKLGAGRLNPLEEKAVARHEVACTLSDLVATAARLLAGEGRFALVYPAAREPELRQALAGHRLVPTLSRQVRPRPHQPPMLLLLEAAFRGSGEGLPPLDVRASGGDYTAEMLEIFRGRPSARGLRPTAAF